MKNENFIFRNFRKLIRVFFGFMKSMFSEFDLNNFPWKFGTYHRTWKIPSEYFSSFKILVRIFTYPLMQ